MLVLADSNLYVLMENGEEFTHVVSMVLTRLTTSLCISTSSSFSPVVYRYVTLILNYSL